MSATLDIKVSKATLVIFGSIWLALAVLGLLASFKSGAWTSPLIWIPLVIGVAYIVLFCRYRVTIVGHDLTYSSPFATRRFDLRELRRADVQGPVRPNQPTVGVHLFSDDQEAGAKVAKLAINLKVFARKDVAELMHILTSAQRDANAHELA